MFGVSTALVASSVPLWVPISAQNKLIPEIIYMRCLETRSTHKSAFSCFGFGQTETRRPSS